MNILNNSIFKVLITGYLFILFILLFRIFTNFTLNAGLHYDEAQYWSWAKNIQWGYYSKPPMLAWLININIFLCGDKETCIRLISPVLHSFTCLIIAYSSYCISKKIKIAVFVGIIYLLMPGVTFSSFFISTDVPLLLFSSLICLFILKMTQNKSNNFIFYTLLSITFALGILSKYALIYLFFPLIMSSIFSNKMREIVLNYKFSFFLSLTFFLMLPHIIWNINNGFVTFNHTYDNANTKQLELNIGNPIFFLISQFFVFGILPLLYIFMKIYKFKSLNNLKEIQKVLIFFFIFPILLITILAFFSRANANWAVVGYPFGCVFLGTLINQERNSFQFYSSLCNQFFMSLIILITIFFSFNNINPILKWDFANSLAEELRVEINKRENVGFIADDREDFSHMLYYLRDLEIPKAKWNGDKRIDDHFELTTDTNDLSGLDIIFLTRTVPTPDMIRRCSNFFKIKDITFNINSKLRQYNIFLLQNWQTK